MTNTEPLWDKEETIIISNHFKSCNDDTIMPFGKYKTFKLREIPDHYFLWLLKQSWINKYPKLKRYCEVVEEDYV